ncbi:SDR family oxidoreductase [Sulfobacillus sp. hq2]|uniref:SDR family NAD(P)-dependent oxidoreductase n=1 Tax=Sulfobacillus TaxID=28033 RepID=UPI000CD1F708|nr:SDR family NAD(P)-dependent oxidoreductase [Sulfobacillus sp. hq2]POB11482.1 oxidoreductase [Sulfobacillus sp. hq2]
MMRSLKGQRVLITGASGGLGQALAWVLAEQGAHVALAARRLERLQELQEALQRSGYKAVAISLDVTDADAVTYGLHRTVEALGGLDILVNNAGLAYFGSVSTMAPQAMATLVATNIYGALYTSQAAVPYLETSRGMIVNISSPLAKRAFPYVSFYAGTKSFLNAVSDGMRLELKARGIHVLTYMAPETATDLAQHTLHAPGVTLPPIRRRLADPRHVALQISRAIRHERREVMASRFFVALGLMMPGLVDWLLYHAMVRRYRHENF